MSKSKIFVAGVLAVRLGCAAQITAGAEDEPQSNWTSADEPCARYDDMRRPVLGDIGVKIDANEPWVDGFRKALGFWNTVLVANFHEETNLSACAIRIINGGPDILHDGIVARSQLTGRNKFRGKIAVSPAAATAMSSDEMYGAAVHELGHMLGLKHNASSRSVMYFLNVNGTEVLDSKDILGLSSHHKLCLTPGKWRSAALPQTCCPGVISRLSGADNPACGLAFQPVRPSERRPRPRLAAPQKSSM